MILECDTGNRDFLIFKLIMLICFLWKQQFSLKKQFWRDWNDHNDLQLTLLFWPFIRFYNLCLFPGNILVFWTSFFNVKLTSSWKLVTKTVASNHKLLVIFRAIHGSEKVGIDVADRRMWPIWDVCHRFSISKKSPTW